jgi:hypothetical protein
LARTWRGLPDTAPVQPGHAIAATDEQVATGFAPSSASAGNIRIKTLREFDRDGREAIWGKHVLEVD